MPGYSCVKLRKWPCNRLKLSVLYFAAAECWFWQSLGRYLLDNLVGPHLLL